MPNWILRTVNMGGESHSHIKLQEEWEREMPYQAEIKYQNGPFFLYIHLFCSDYKRTGAWLYREVADYILVHISQTSEQDWAHLFQNWD